MAFLTWLVLLCGFLSCSYFKDYAGIAAFGVPLFPLTGFLAIRGFTRWLGKNLRGDF